MVPRGPWGYSFRLFTETCGKTTPSVSASPSHLPLRGRLTPSVTASRCHLPRRGRLTPSVTASRCHLPRRGRLTPSVTASRCHLPRRGRLTPSVTASRCHLPDSLRQRCALPPPSEREAGREAMSSPPKGSRLGPLSEGAVSEADWGSEGSWRAASEGVLAQSHKKT